MIGLLLIATVFYWFCPIMDMLFCLLLVSYLELLGLVFNNYLL